MTKTDTLDGSKEQNGPTEPTRVDQDSLGDVELPMLALYSTNAVRALENFGNSSAPVSSFPLFVGVFAKIKKAAAQANQTVGAMDADVAEAISSACDELIDGQHHEHLIVPLLEASGGTSLNMNFNEVIANRAGQILGETKLGSFERVKPNDHVNKSQSTNDVLPSAIKLSCYVASESLLDAGCKLVDAFRDLATKYRNSLRLGRTCMQPAQPMTYGQLFDGYASGIERSLDKIDAARRDLHVVPMGATAIGTGLGAVPGYREEIAKLLSETFGFQVKVPADYFDAMQSADGFVRLSSELKIVADLLAKIAGDLVILSSNGQGGLGEIILPAVQPGSSIMAGKVNPVICMLVQQTAFLVAGNHTTVSLGALHGQMEINHFEPVMANALFGSLSSMETMLTHFRTRCIADMEVDEARSYANLECSPALSSIFLDSLGYKTVSKLVAMADEQGLPFTKIAIDKGLLTPQRLREELARAAQGNMT